MLGGGTPGLGTNLSNWLRAITFDNRSARNQTFFIFPTLVLRQSAREEFSSRPTAEAGAVIHYQSGGYDSVITVFVTHESHYL